jgi:hypothetical protein
MNGCFESTSEFLSIQSTDQDTCSSYLTKMLERHTTLKLWGSNAKKKFNGGSHPSDMQVGSCHDEEMQGSNSFSHCENSD